jgi:osmotically-inducible protein OsmY
MLKRSLRTLALAASLATLSGATAAAAGVDQQKPPAPPARTSENLKDRVEHRLETHATLRKYDVKVAVDNGIATLTGEVATDAQKAEAAKVAGAVRGISKVVNNITVDKNEDVDLTDRAKKGLSKAGNPITDAWITTKVKWFLTFDDTLDGSNINVDTANKVVTLKGTVKSAAQKTRAVQLAQQTEGVGKVVDQMTIGGTH